MDQSFGTSIVGELFVKCFLMQIPLCHLVEAVPITNTWYISVPNQVYVMVTCGAPKPFCAFVRLGILSRWSLERRFSGLHSHLSKKAVPKNIDPNHHWRGTYIISSATGFDICAWAAHSTSCHFVGTCYPIAGQLRPLAGMYRSGFEPKLVLLLSHASYKGVIGYFSCTYG